MLRNICLTLLLVFLLSCDSAPLSKGSRTEDLKLLFYFVNNVGYSTASVFWTCSSSSNGYIVYGPNGTENTAFSLKQGKTHVVNLTGLPTGTTIHTQHSARLNFLIPLCCFARLERE